MNDQVHRKVQVEPETVRCAPLSIRLPEMFEAILLPFVIGGIAAIAIGGRADFWHDPRSLVIIGFTLIVIALISWRAFHLSLVATQRQVVVSNTWRAHKLLWLDVTRVGLGEISAAGGVLRPAIAFTLRNGRIVRAQATPAHEREWRPLLAALRQLAPPSVEFPDPPSTTPRGWRLKRFKFW